MGDISKDIQEGLICAGCGVLLDGDEPGYVRVCEACDPKKFGAQEQAESLGIEEIKERMEGVLTHMEEEAEKAEKDLEKASKKLRRALKLTHWTSLGTALLSAVFFLTAGEYANDGNVARTVHHGLLGIVMTLWTLFLLFTAKIQIGRL